MLHDSKLNNYCLTQPIGLINTNMDVAHAHLKYHINSYAIIHTYQLHMNNKTHLTPFFQGRQKYKSIIIYKQNI